MAFECVAAHFLCDAGVFAWGCGEGGDVVAAFFARGALRELRHAVGVGGRGAAVLWDSSAAGLIHGFSHLVPQFVDCGGVERGVGFIGVKGVGFNLDAGCYHHFDECTF